MTEDELYSHFCVSIPCYVPMKNGCIITLQTDNWQTLVLLTDIDLLERWKDRDKKYISLNDFESFRLFLDELPGWIKNVAFDPNSDCVKESKAYRKFPMDVLKENIPAKIN